jgi:AraC family transcriptional regulator
MRMSVEQANLGSRDLAAPRGSGTEPPVRAHWPRVLRSSQPIGWDGVVAWTFDEPTQLDDRILPPNTDPSLLLITKGGLVIESRPVGGPWSRYVVREGDLVLRPAREAASMVRWRGLSEEIRSVHIHLSRQIVASVAEKVLGRDPQRLRLVSRAGFQDPLLAQILFALDRELEEPAPAGKLYAETAARLLAIHLLRHYSTESVAKEKEAADGLQLSYRQLDRVVEYVRAHLDEDLTLQRLAGEIGLSPYHFARLFRQTTGETPHQFVLRERVRRAQELLSETDLPLAAIAVESGFASQSHFTHVFRRQVGCTPRQYRREEVA